MKINRPAVRYHGGKWRIAKKIICIFPHHDRYVEPFGGGASVLLQKMKSDYEIYNDLDGGVYNFFKVLRTDTDNLVESLNNTPFSRREFNEAQEDSGDCFENARRFVILSCLGFSSDAATRKGKTGFRSHSDAVSTFAKGFDHLYRVRDRLRNVVFENIPAIDVIKKYDMQGALQYIDPPYVLSERNNISGGYRHELTDDDHCQLSKVLHDAKSHIVISGYNSDMYNDLFSDWKKIEINAMAQSNKGSIQKTEVLWLSPSLLESNVFSLFPSVL